MYLSTEIAVRKRDTNIKQTNSLANKQTQMKNVSMSINSFYRSCSLMNSQNRFSIWTARRFSGSGSGIRHMT